MGYSEVVWVCCVWEHGCDMGVEYNVVIVVCCVRSSMEVRVYCVGYSIV